MYLLEKLFNVDDGNVEKIKGNVILEPVIVEEQLRDSDTSGNREAEKEGFLQEDFLKDI